MTIDPPSLNSQVVENAAKSKNHDEKIEEALLRFKKNIAGEKFLCPPSDRVLLTFLQTKRYDLTAAQKLLRSYDSFRLRYSPTWLEVRSSEVRSVFPSGVIDLLNVRDHRQRRILWLRAGKWMQKQHSADLCLKMGGLMGELALLESHPAPASGLIAIIDMDGFTVSQLKCVSPSFVKKLMHYLVSCLPMRVFTAHVIRESSGFSVVFALFRKFIDEQMKKRIFFHGHDLASLHKVVDSQILPVELGGSCPTDPERWVKMLQQPDVIREMESMGYTFVDDA